MTAAACDLRRQWPEYPLDLYSCVELRKPIRLATGQEPTVKHAHVHMRAKNQRQSRGTSDEEGTLSLVSCAAFSRHASGPIR